jgi:hypothetical protein
MPVPEFVRFTELLPAPPDDRHAEEWETYRREVARLLAEGREGTYALIQGERIVGIAETEAEAWAWADSQYPGHGLIKQILENEPGIQLPQRHLTWLASNSQLRPTG